MINILQQHDTIEEMGEQILAVEQMMLTAKLRIELLENWIQKQSEELNDLGEKVESNKQFNYKVEAIEVEIESFKAQKVANTDLVEESANKTEISLNCGHCDDKFTNAISLETHIQEHGMVVMFAANNFT